MMHRIRPRPPQYASARQSRRPALSSSVHSGGGRASSSAAASVSTHTPLHTPPYWPSSAPNASLAHSPSPRASTSRILEPTDAPHAVKSSTESQGHTDDGRGSEPERPGEISDQEWEIRTGRAIYILQQTLPDFFQTGLVSSLEIPDLRSSANDKNGNGKTDVESIYSPKIRLAYKPPVELPPPFPRTLHVDGLQLYMASSAFVRHTLNALYSDLHVELRRVRVHGPRSSNGSSPSQEAVLPGAHKHRSIREKSLFVGLSVSGVARVSGARGGWEVNSTYTFSPLTGLIQLHSIDSIEPAPHQAVFDALRTALMKLGLASSPGRETPGAGAGAARTQGGVKAT